MSKSKGLSRRARERLKARGQESVEGQGILPDVVDARSLKIPDGCRSEVLKLASDLMRFEPAARRAKMEGREENFLGILESGGVLGPQFVEDIRKIGEALIRAIDSQLSTVTDKEQRANIVQRFNEQYQELLSATAGMPLLRLSLREAGFFAFQREILDILLSGHDPMKLAIVRKEKYNAYRAMVEAHNMGMELDLPRTFKVRLEDQNEDMAMFDEWRHVRFVPTGDKDQFVFQAINIKSSRAHPDSAPLATVRFGIMEQQSPLAIARIEIICEGARVLCELSRLTGELCPIHACVFNLKEALGNNYQILKEIIIRGIDRAYRDGKFKDAAAIKRPAKPVMLARESERQFELPAISHYNFSAILAKMGVKLTSQYISPEERHAFGGTITKDLWFWEYQGRRVQAIMVDVDSWLFEQQYLSILNSLGISLETFIDNIPMRSLREEFERALARRKAV